MGERTIVFTYDELAILKRICKSYLGLTEFQPSIDLCNRVIAEADYKRRHCET